MKGDVHALKEIMEKSEELGMQTFDSHLLKLYKAGRISLDETLKNADSPNNMKVKINLMQDAPGQDTAEAKQARAEELSSLSLEEIVVEEDKVMTEDEELEELLRLKAEREAKAAGK